MARKNTGKQNQQNQQPTQRARKPMSLNSVPTILKKVDGVLNTISEKEGITRAEKLDLRIVKMYLNTLIENVNEILESKSTVKQQQQESVVDTTVGASDAPDDDDDDDE